MKDKLFHKLKSYDQHHILEHHDNLPEEKKANFLDTLQSFDFDHIFNIHKKFSMETDAKKTCQTIKTAKIITLPTTYDKKGERERARKIGESLIRDNKVAVLIVAGGQGTRLGYNKPKGTFKISPVKGKTLFQLFTEQVMALSKKYSAKIPLLIMTSYENNEDTRIFFKENNYFGYNKDMIYFFMQGMIPTVTPGGKLIMKDESQIAANPDGHGGSLKALFDSGILKRLTDDGYKELFYCQVDNPLVKIADPVFLGYHKMTESEASTKVVRRRSINEKVGVYLSLDGKDAIIEYSDLDPSYMNALDENGDILYWAGNTAIHIFSLHFVERINMHGFALPYHCALKTIETRDRDGKISKIDVWKFETFVFDAIPLAQKACAMEVVREEEFSPVKNKSGEDSPEKAQEDMCNIFRKWLEEAGATVKPSVKVEVSPLFALDGEEFKNKIEGKGIIIDKDTYFGD